jgi:hypothetical protein
MLTIKQLQDECVNFFGLEHKNTRSFFMDCENVSDVDYLNARLQEMKRYEKINNSKIAHIIVQVDAKDVVVVELYNKSYDFYATAFVDIRRAVAKFRPQLDFIEILDIIIE